MRASSLPGGQFEPSRAQPDHAVSRRMAARRRRDTGPELRLRRVLHRRGMRFRLQVRVPGNQRRSIDIAFPRARLAVFVDGCFWHSCGEHGTQPATNAEWWHWKLQRNQVRDRDTDRLLKEAGWSVLRIWEHVSSEDAADLVETTYREILASR